MKFQTYLALIASVTAINLRKMPVTELSLIQEDHACDYIDDSGEEISTSLMPTEVQLEADIHMNDEDDTVEGAKQKFAEMQAKMD